MLAKKELLFRMVMIYNWYEIFKSRHKKPRSQFSGCPIRVSKTMKVNHAISRIRFQAQNKQTTDRYSSESFFDYGRDHYVLFKYRGY